MQFDHFFKVVVDQFLKENIKYALAGGMAVSLYRKQPRLTDDLDFLFLANDRTLEKGKIFIESLDLKVGIARKANLEGGPFFAIKKNNTQPWILVGRKEGTPGLDLLLPGLPWFKNALKRSEYNLIDFGIGTRVPTITLEDAIISKLFAVKNNSQRFKDLDDLQSISESKNEIDEIYIINTLHELNLKVSEQAKTACKANSQLHSILNR